MGSGSEPAARPLSRGQHACRSRQRSSAHVAAGRLGDDRDLRAGRGVAARARRARRLDPDHHVNQAADPHLLGRCRVHRVQPRRAPVVRRVCSTRRGGHRIDKLHPVLAPKHSSIGPIATSKRKLKPTGRTDSPPRSVAEQTERAHNTTLARDSSPGSDTASGHPGRTIGLAPDRFADAHEQMRTRFDTAPMCCPPPGWQRAHPGRGAGR